MQNFVVGNLVDVNDWDFALLDVLRKIIAKTDKRYSDYSLRVVLFSNKTALTEGDYTLSCWI